MKKILFLFLASFVCAFSQNELDNKIIGSSYMEGRAGDFLREMCDNFGGRSAGSTANEKAVDYLISELKKLGIDAKTESFDMPVWTRKDDKVEIISPYRKIIHAYALGYVGKCSEFNAKVIELKKSDSATLKETEMSGAILLAHKGSLSRGATIKLAAAKGAKAVLFAEDKGDGITTLGTANFTGEITSIPAFIVQKEDAEWLVRLAQNGSPATASVLVNSETRIASVRNVIATFPGKSPEKICVTAHIDSWDIAQGSDDNGSGTAIIFDVARLINKYSKNNEKTIEIVWVNGEENGLFGSKDYVARHKSEVIADINLDMPGSPTGIDAMGFETFTPLFTTFLARFKGCNMKDGVTQNPWLNSDHQSFMMEGIPAFTLNGYMDKEIYYNYHSYGDTFDKIAKRNLSDAAGFTALLAIELANTKENIFIKLNPQETIDYFQKYNLYEKAQVLFEKKK